MSHHELIMEINNLKRSIPREVSDEELLQYLHKLNHFIVDFQHLLGPFDGVLRWTRKDLLETKNYRGKIPSDISSRVKHSYIFQQKTMRFLNILEESVRDDLRKSSQSRKTVTIKGVSVDFKKQKVSHPKYGSHTFRSGKIPWRIIRICASESPDGLGESSLESLKIEKHSIHKKLNLINKNFQKPILHYKDGFVFVDPDFET